MSSRLSFSSSSPSSFPSPPPQNFSLSDLPSVESLCSVMYRGNTSTPAFSLAFDYFSSLMISPSHVESLLLCLENSRDAHLLLFSGQALGKVISSFYQTFSLLQSNEIKNRILTVLGGRTDLPPFVTSSVVELAAKLIKYSWGASQRIRRNQSKLHGSGDDDDNENENNNISDDSKVSDPDDSAEFLSSFRKFFDYSETHMAVAFQLSSHIISQFTKPSTAVELLQNHRVNSRQFRDSCLQTVLVASISTLNQICDGQLSVSPDSIMKISIEALQVACLSIHFEFHSIMGGQDDAMDESLITLNISVPTSWRSLLEDRRTLGTPLKIIEKLEKMNTIRDNSPQAKLSSLAFEFLGLLSAVRRSLFPNGVSRAAYSNSIAESFISILEGPSPLLIVSSCGQSFLVALTRFLTTHPITELLTFPHHTKLFQLCAEFCNSLLKLSASHNEDEAAQVSPHCLHFILTIWNRMATESPTVKGIDKIERFDLEEALQGAIDQEDLDEISSTKSVIIISPSSLSTSSSSSSSSPPSSNLFISLQIAIEALSQTIIDTRISLISKAITNDIESNNFSLRTQNSELSDLFQPTVLDSQLRLLPSMVRIAYGTMKQFLSQRINDMMGQYQSLLNGNNNNNNNSQGETDKQMAILEGQLAYVVWVTSSVLGYSLNHVIPREDQENYDAELVSILMKAMQFLLSQRLPIDSQQDNNNINNNTPSCYLSTVYLCRSFIHYCQQVRMKWLSVVSAHRFFEDILDPLSYTMSSRLKQMEILFYYKISNLIKGDPVPSIDSLTSHGGGSGSHMRRNHSEPSSSSISMDSPNGDNDNNNGNPTLIPPSISPENVLDLILSFLFRSIQIFPSNNELIYESLDLLDHLAMGYATSQLLSKNSPIMEFITNHSMETKLPFMDVPLHSDQDNIHSDPLKMKGKIVTKFYSCIGKILFKPDNFDSHFHSFMRAFEDEFMNLYSSLNNGRNDTAMRRGVIAIRKLTGIVECCPSPTYYNPLFDCIFPILSKVIQRFFETYFADPQVSNCVLSLCAELSYNKNGRIDFPVNSPNGVLLFKEMRKSIEILSTRMTHIEKKIELKDIIHSATSAASLSSDSNDKWKKKLRGISLCLKIGSQVLSGRFVPFGIMSEYKDPSVDTCVKEIFKMVLSVPTEELFGFSDLTNNYILFISSVAKNHADILYSLHSSQFISVITSLNDALTFDNYKFVLQSAEALESIFSEFNQSRKKLQNEENSIAIKRGMKEFNKAAVAIVNQFGKHFKGLDSQSGDNNNTNNTSYLLLLELFKTAANIYLFHPSCQSYHFACRMTYQLVTICPSLLMEYSSYLLSHQIEQTEDGLKFAFQKYFIDANLSFTPDQKAQNAYTTQWTAFRSHIQTFCVKPSDMPI